MSGVERSVPVAPAATYEEMVSADWLTAALSDRFPGVQVDTVKVESVLHGVGTKAMLALTYRDDGTYRGDGGGAPQRLCAKAGWEEANAHLNRSGVYAREARFYHEVLPVLDIRAPRCYYSAASTDGTQGIVLLEDLVETGVTFASATTGLTTDEAARFVESLAELHAAPRRASLNTDWMRMPETSAIDAFYTDRLQGHLDGPRAESLPSAMRDAAPLIEAFRALGASRRDGPEVVVHGDCHARNLFVDRDGSAGFFDFQTAHLDHWSIDVAYLLGANLSHADRRASVEDLLRHYVEHLGARGIEVAWDDAWLAYRRALVYGLYLWAITRTSVQPLDAITAFVDRLGHAAYEAESYQALGV